MGIRWTGPIPTSPFLPARPETALQPTPRRVLLEVGLTTAGLARKLEQSLHAALSDANEVELEPAGELLIWLEAVSAEAGRVAAALERRAGR